MLIAPGLSILKTSVLTTSRPEVTSRPIKRREMTESSPLLLRVASTAVTHTRPPAMTGDDHPPLTGTFHAMFCVSLHSRGSPCSVE
jgi:hypothetical protein